MSDEPSTLLCPVHISYHLLTSKIEGGVDCFFQLCMLGFGGLPANFFKVRERIV